VHDVSWDHSIVDVGQLILDAGGHSVKVLSDDPARLRQLIHGPDVTVTGSPGSPELILTGLTAHQIGAVAFEHAVPVYELTPQTVSLEEAFMAMTGDDVEYHGTTAAPSLSRSAA
jgi:ABC-2 type transport system ATP-binding protein